MWTDAQRAVIAVLALVILAGLSIQLARRPVTIPTPQPVEGARANELALRLDPNTATQAELAAIPTIGDKLAGAIVDYRIEFAKTHPASRAFARLADLQKVRGIGPAKAEALSAYLVFPATSP